MRPIDADSLRYRRKDYGGYDDVGDEERKRGILFLLEEDIAASPTMDAVPVVRCKDCKYRPIDTGTNQYGHELEFPNEYKCPCQCGDNWYSWMPDDEWFCANGERRTNG